MKRFLPTILSIIIIIIGGFFIYPNHKNTIKTTFEKKPSITKIKEMLGVVKSFDQKNHLLKIILSDQNEENVLINSNQNINLEDIGSLIEINGVRDSSTRQIIAQEIKIINSPNLIITSPSINDMVTSPIVVSGFGRTNENFLNWRIKNQKNEILKKGEGMINALDNGYFGPFRLEIFLPVLENKKFILEIFEESVKDGSEINLVSWPLELINTKTTEIQIFFPNYKKNTNHNCSMVYPVKRKVAKTSALGRLSLLELIDGPTKEEKKEGYFSNLPNQSYLNFLSINNHKAIVDFSFLNLNQNKECQNISFQKEIKKTLEQFFSILSVDILENGEKIKNYN